MRTNNLDTIIVVAFQSIAAYKKICSGSVVFKFLRVKQLGGKILYEKVPGCTFVDGVEG